MTREPTQPVRDSAEQAASGAALDQTGLLREVARGAGEAGVFGAIEVTGNRVHCGAKGSGEPAFYRVEITGGEVCVSLVTAARYLSQSIEADLVNTGDKLEDLLWDELVDQGYEGAQLRVEHFRDPEKLFTFRSRLPQTVEKMRTKAGATTLTRVLLAYEACFRPLGDMEAGED